jgi:hypothetical protein
VVIDGIVLTVKHHKVIADYKLGRKKLERKINSAVIGISLEYYRGNVHLSLFMPLYGYIDIHTFSNLLTILLNKETLRCITDALNMFLAEAKHATDEITKEIEKRKQLYENMEKIIKGLVNTLNVYTPALMSKA